MRKHGLPVHAADADRRPAFADGKGNRPTDQAEADDGDSVERRLGGGHRSTPNSQVPTPKNSQHRKLGVGRWGLEVDQRSYLAQPRLETGSRQKLRPIAGAMIRIAAIRRSNCDGNIDWAPSLSARSGSLCTSMISPSAPAATAARAIGATMSRRPAPWLGSAMIGRWLSFLTTGIAEMSKVLRVAVSNVRMPRSQRITSPLPPLSPYSADSSHSSIVAEMPRLSSTGLRV